MFELVAEKWENTRSCAQSLDVHGIYFECWINLSKYHLYEIHSSMRNDPKGFELNANFDRTDTGDTNCKWIKHEFIQCIERIQKWYIWSILMISQISSKEPKILSHYQSVFMSSSVFLREYFSAFDSFAEIRKQYPTINSSLNDFCARVRRIENVNSSESTRATDISSLISAFLQKCYCLSVCVASFVLISFCQSVNFSSLLSFRYDSCFLSYYECIHNPLLSVFSSLVLCSCVFFLCLLLAAPDSCTSKYGCAYCGYFQNRNVKDWRETTSKREVVRFLAIFISSNVLF